MNTMHTKNDFKPEASLFVHHVLFYLKDPHSDIDKNKLLEGLQLLTTISNIKFYNIGTPANTHRSVIEKDYTFSWLCFFDGASEEAAYQIHPTHDLFRIQYEHLWEKVVVYDAITV